MADPAPSARTRTGVRWLWLWILGFGLVLAGIAAVTIALDRSTPREQPDGMSGFPFGGAFALTAPGGQTVTDKTLAGRPYAIFFGFTRCPDVCPTSLARMARLRKLMGGAGDQFAIVFVSVDPEHDKPGDIGRYVALFETPIIGLTGTDAELAQIKKGFGVFVKKVPIEGGDYTIDHTATVYLMTKDGKLAGSISPQEADDIALKKLQNLVS